jgi:glutaminyl-peptide cyclotransferase
MLTPQNLRIVDYETSNRLIAFILVVFFPLVFGACPRNEGPPKNPRVGVSSASPSPSPPPIPTTFNGERAMDHVRKQLEFGPRPPDTPALAKARAYIVSELKSYGLQVSLDEFTAPTPKGNKRMANIIADIPGETKNLILITSHYDTKYFADMEFVGANDPASSVATLLEIGRVLGSAREKPKVNYRLVFFDGEEAFCENWDDCKNGDDPDNTYGSRRYVQRLREKKELEQTRGLILLDMMGYKQLDLGRDTMSTKWLQDIIWQTGRELGHGDVFVDRPEGVGGDDHEPFLRAGIDAVDIIQLNSYPYWHEPTDTIDKISAQSMKIVGDTVLASLPRIADKVAK